MLEELQEMEQMADEYERLAYCLKEFVAIYEPETLEDDGLLRKLENLQLNALYPSNYSEQLRTYCEWHCTTFPLELVEASPRFETVLRTIYRPILESLDSPTSKNILLHMGFTPVNQIRVGLQVLMRQIESKLERFAFASSVPSLNREEIHGLVDSSFGHIEEMLEYIVSYYVRLFAAQLLGVDNPLELMERAADSLDLASREKRSLRKWATGEWDKLIISSSIPIIKALNGIAVNSDTPIGAHFQSLFGSNGTVPDHQSAAEYRRILDEDLITRIEQVFAEYRHKYAHKRMREDTDLESYYLEARTTLQRLLSFANSIDARKVIPEVVAVRRRLSVGDGSVRLDCLHEDGNLRPHRFDALIYMFMSRKQAVECFFPVQALRRLAGTGTGLATEYQRIIMPVDFRLREVVLL